VNSFDEPHGFARSIGATGDCRPVGGLAEERFGPGALKDAILRTIQAADIVGIRAILIHALSQDAKTFYERCGFYASAVDPMTLMLTLQEARAMVEG
jgi:hypothetical protein